MFPNGNEVYWLTVTNAALGLAVLAFLILLVWSVIRDIFSPRTHRRV